MSLQVFAHFLFVFLLLVVGILCKLWIRLSSGMFFASISELFDERCLRPLGVG